LWFSVTSQDFQELPRRDNPNAAPSRGEMFEITRHQVGRPGRLRTFKENVVVGIGTFSNGFLWLNPEPFLANGSKRRSDYVFLAPESRPPDNLFVLGIHPPLTQS
jgi:hypothetical protein